MTVKGDVERRVFPIGSPCRKCPRLDRSEKDHPSFLSSSGGGEKAASFLGKWRRGRRENTVRSRAGTFCGRSGPCEHDISQSAASSGILAQEGASSGGDGSASSEGPSRSWTFRRGQWWQILPLAFSFFVTAGSRPQRRQRRIVTVPHAIEASSASRSFMKAREEKKSEHQFPVARVMLHRHDGVKREAPGRGRGISLRAGRSLEVVAVTAAEEEVGLPVPTRRERPRRSRKRCEPRAPPTRWGGGGGGVVLLGENFLRSICTERRGHLDSRSPGALTRPHSDVETTMPPVSVKEAESRKS